EEGGADEAVQDDETDPEDHDVTVVHEDEEADDIFEVLSVHGAVDVVVTVAAEPGIIEIGAEAAPVLEDDQLDDQEAPFAVEVWDDTEEALVMADGCWRLPVEGRDGGG
ncbi:MAG: hypothetical protein Q9223_007487, partial [Gallowayella weberi]